MDARDSMPYATYNVRGKHPTPVLAKIQYTSTFSNDAGARSVEKKSDRSDRSDRDQVR